MSEKKVIGRKVTIALGIVCVILAVALAGVIAYYTRIINDKDTLYSNYVATHSHSNEEYDSLQSQVNSLQSQVNSLKAAQLHEVNFNWEWNEP
jgi:peptidoglycan hydrolase CwlO-like protein